MKTIVRNFALFFAIFSVMLSFSSCGNKEKDDVDSNDGNDNSSKLADYTVTIIDGIGTPISDIFVSFTNENGETEKTVSNKDGKAILYDAPVGKYSVTVEQGLSSAKIIDSKFELTAEKQSINVIVLNPEKAVAISGVVDEDTYAYNVSESAYNVVGTPGSMSYFVFNASIKGIYNFSFESSDPDMTIGFYGIPMFVQDHHLIEGEYDGKSFEIVVQDPSTPYVIGLDFKTASEAVLKISRAGDAPFDPNYAPFETVSASEVFKTFSTGNLTDLNIADPALSVTLGDDGYYYTGSGKLVYVRISSTTDYLDASIAMIAGCVDQNFGQNFGGYVYDENGDFVGKYSFNTMIEAYYEHCDANGVYPLTAELAEAIKVHGESTGWWNPNAANFLFSGKPYIKDNAWLFLCCTE